MCTAKVWPYNPGPGQTQYPWPDYWMCRRPTDPRWTGTFNMQDLIPYTEAFRFVPDDTQTIGERIEATGIAFCPSRDFDWVNESILKMSLEELGTAMAVDIMNVRGGFPTDNWQLGVLPGSDNINGTAIIDNILTKRKACFACPVACFAANGYRLLPVVTGLGIVAQIVVDVAENAHAIRLCPAGICLSGQF